VGGCRCAGGIDAWTKSRPKTTRGESVFGLIQTDARGREGLLTTDRGYAEIPPVSWALRMDDRDGLLLTPPTRHESLSRSGPLPRLRLRTPAPVEGLLEHGLVSAVEAAAAQSHPPLQSQRPRRPKRGRPAPLSAFGSVSANVTDCEPWPGAARLPRPPSTIRQRRLDDARVAIPLLEPLRTDRPELAGQRALASAPTEDPKTVSRSTSHRRKRQNFVIETAYRQIFFHAFKVDRDHDPASSQTARDGQITVRDFIRPLYA